MRRMLSSISRSFETRAMRPVASVRSGKAQPVPMNSCPMPIAPLVDLDHAAADGGDARGAQLAGRLALDLHRGALEVEGGGRLDRHGVPLERHLAGVGADADVAPRGDGDVPFGGDLQGGRRAKEEALLPGRAEG